MNKIKKLLRKGLSEEMFDGICHAVCCILLAAVILILLIMPFVRLKMPFQDSCEDECAGGHAVYYSACISGDAARPTFCKKEGR